VCVCVYGIVYYNSASPPRHFEYNIYKLFSEYFPMMAWPENGRADGMIMHILS